MRVKCINDFVGYENKIYSIKTILFKKDIFYECLFIDKQRSLINDGFDKPYFKIFYDKDNL